MRQIILAFSILFSSIVAAQTDTVLPRSFREKINARMAQNQFADSLIFLDTAAVINQLQELNSILSKYKNSNWMLLDSIVDSRNIQFADIIPDSSNSKYYFKVKITSSYDYQLFLSSLVPKLDKLKMLKKINSLDRFIYTDPPSGTVTDYIPHRSREAPATPGAFKPIIDENVIAKKYKEKIKTLLSENQPKLSAEKPPLTFSEYEKWEKEDALKYHMKSPADYIKYRSIFLGELKSTYNIY